MKQSHFDSVMEVVTNTAVGYVISVIMWHYLAAWMHLPVTTGDNLFIVSAFTVTSLARQYIIRRAFNGRSVWQTIRRVQP